MEKQINWTDQFKGWLELVRPPNLFTVPGDVLGGAALAIIPPNKIPALLPGLIISFLLYISGLILNDFFDQKMDRVERPERPLPSGRVSPKSALTVAGLFIFLALIIGYLFLSFFWITIGLAALILSYNSFARKIPSIGFIIMGLCRGFNLLLGASVSSNPFTALVLAAAGVETFYIIAVSAFAYHETKNSPSRIILWLPFIFLLSITILLWLSGISILEMCLILLSLVFIFSIIWQMRTNDGEVPQKIGDLIRSLILIQCVFIAIALNRNPVYPSYYLITIFILLAFFLASGWTAKKFYGS
jgi:4-hydroxybenzoate polyprenyltransferase